MSKLKLSLLHPTSPLPLASLIAFLYVHGQVEGTGHTLASADGRHPSLSLSDGTSSYFGSYLCRCCSYPFIS